MSNPKPSVSLPSEYVLIEFKTVFSDLFEEGFLYEGNLLSRILLMDGSEDVINQEYDLPVRFCYSNSRYERWSKYTVSSNINVLRRILVVPYLSGLMNAIHKEGTFTLRYQKLFLSFIKLSHYFRYGNDEWFPEIARKSYLSIMIKHAKLNVITAAVRKSGLLLETYKKIFEWLTYEMVNTDDDNATEKKFQSEYVKLFYIGLIKCINTNCHIPDGGIGYFTKDFESRSQMPAIYNDIFINSPSSIRSSDYYKKFGILARATASYCTSNQNPISETITSLYKPVELDFKYDSSESEIIKLLEELKPNKDVIYLNKSIAGVL